MALKRAYLIILLAFVWLMLWGTVGGLVALQSGTDGIATLAYAVAIVGLMIGLFIGCIEVAIAKGYSPWLGLVLGLSGPIGLLIVELLPEQPGARN